MRTRRLTPIVTFAVLAAASCTGGDDDAVATTIEAVETVAAVETTVLSGLDAFCAAAADLIAGSRGVDTLGAASTPADVEAAMAGLRDAYDNLADDAPAEVAGDVFRTAEALYRVILILEDAGYDLNQLTREYTAARNRYLDASIQVEEYLADNCVVGSATADG